MIVDIIFRAVRIVMISKRMKRLRNLYLHFDNHSVNKNFTVIAACGALTLLGKRFNFYICQSRDTFLGVCRKVKPSYGERGHGHNDGDARMGDVNRDLVITDVTDFEVFSQTVKHALQSHVSYSMINSRN